MVEGFPNPLFNNEPQVKTGFNANGYERFMASRMTIVNKEKQEVPFRVNPAQHSLNYWMERYFDLLVLKARKMGFSSDALGIATAKFILGKNERCVSSSFDQTASNKQLARAKHYIRSYERAMSEIQSKEFKLPLKYNSKTELVLEARDENGRIYTNSLMVGTAKNTSFGRGDDITFLHLTEVSLSDVPLLLAGVGEACVAGAHKILETTADGWNTYKQFWDDTILNKTGFAGLFYSPEWEYSKEFLEKKAKTLGRLMPQEYPMTPEEAFIASGETYFEKEGMKQYLDSLEELSKKDPEPLPEHLDNDMFTLHRKLEQGEFIVLFVDTAGEGRDWNAGIGLSKNKLDIPITMHHEGSIVDVTPKLKLVLEWIYKQTGVKPVVCYETNNGGGYELARLDRLNKEQKYVVYKQYKLNARGELEQTDKLGWNTNSATRPEMLKGAKDLVNNNLVKIYHRPTITQMFSFIKKKTPSGWRAEAEVGAHDDLIMALAGAWVLYQTEEPQIEYDQTDFVETDVFDQEGFY